MNKVKEGYTVPAHLCRCPDIINPKPVQVVLSALSLEATQGVRLYFANSGWLKPRAASSFLSNYIIYRRDNGTGSHIE